jgi:hypothetical protein
MPRDLAHGRHHSFVKRRLADQTTHMKCAGGNFREHMLTLDLEVFRTHYAIPSATTWTSCKHRANYLSDRLPAIGLALPHKDFGTSRWLAD